MTTKKQYVEYPVGTPKNCPCTYLAEHLEVWCIAGFSLGFFFLCAANQCGRMQFNSGVRHVVPVIPFLFLLAAGMLLRMPTILAAFVGIVSTYWSWCLAMCRDVEQGLGVFESLIHVTLKESSSLWACIP